MEQAMYDALARVMLTKGYDNNGNVLPNPLHNAVYDWADFNKEKIAEAINKKVDWEDLASKIAKIVIDKLTEDPTRSSFRTNMSILKTEKLQELVLEKVATQLAEDELKKLKSTKDQ